MKKVLLTFTGKQYPEGGLQFANKLNQLQQIMLSGVFVPEMVFGNTYSFTTGLPMATYMNTVSDEEGESINTNIRRFSTFCDDNGINFRIHQDYSDMALPALKTESRFADAMIISSEKFFDTHFLNDPNPDLKEVLHAAECPVFTVPESFESITRNIVAYDGSSSSVYAIKQFAYLFPELCNSETLFVYLEEQGDKPLPNERNLQELVSLHFKNARIVKLNISQDTFVSTWLKENKGSLLITGSYGRSGVAELFSRSFSAAVISEHFLPVFIAHR